ncbi:MAG: hypothetical protein QOC82_1326 [Frankiaceae bacterium]|jgi:hypothetical protein|nr:hypothetical protein [Frankiaceae bacterium]
MSSRRRLTRGVAAMSIAALSLLAPAAALARTAAVPTLGAVNQITATGTSSVQVRLASPMLLNEDHGKGKFILPGLTVSDPAKFVALALVADKGIYFADEPNYRQRPSFFVFRIPTGSTSVIADGKNANPNVLPAGTYRLTVVATGPEHLTWRLPLPQRGASIKPTARVSVNYRIQTWTGPVPAISYAMDAPTTSVAQVWGSVWFSTTHVQRVGGSTFCLYNGTDPNATATAKVPGVCTGLGAMGGPVDGVAVPPLPETTNPVPSAGAITVDSTQKLNTEFLPQVGVKQTIYTGGIINAATVFYLWLPVG